MTTHETYLEATARRSWCAVCKSQPRVAWLGGEERLRCECWPLAPTLEKLPRGAVARYLAGEEPQDALVKMTGDRILDKRRK